ncbi:MAG: hypothetical protein K2X03_03315, partial [Bryobacteraceae bacterium]|nr:hypothetical protein [Bryobacteraceae bacterium]
MPVTGLNANTERPRPNWAGWKPAIIAVLSLLGIVVHLVLRFGFDSSASASRLPLLVILVAGGLPMLSDLLVKLVKREFGSDLLGGISIV